MQARNGTNRFSSESAETTNRDSFSPSDEMSYVVSKDTGAPGVRWTCCRRKGVVRTGSEGCRENSTTSSPYSATRLSRSRAVSTRAFPCRFRTASTFASADPATAAKLFFLATPALRSWPLPRTRRSEEHTSELQSQFHLFF